MTTTIVALNNITKDKGASVLVPSSGGNAHDEAYFLDLLPDETLVEIVLWLPSIKDCIHWSQTCRRLHCLIQQDEDVVAKVVQSSRGEMFASLFSFTTITTFEQLALCERVRDCGLLTENRIGFPTGTCSMCDSNSNNLAQDESEDEDANVNANANADTNEEGEGEDEDAVAIASRLASSSPMTFVGDNFCRLANVQQLLQQFPRLQVSVKAHCGAAEPIRPAHDFSRTRGNSVVDELTRYGNSARRRQGKCKNIQFCDHVTLRPWGRRIVDFFWLVGSSHPFVALAETGQGWVELYLELDGMEVPARPDFYRRFFEIRQHPLYIDTTDYLNMLYGYSE